MILRNPFYIFDCPFSLTNEGGPLYFAVFGLKVRSNHQSVSFFLGFGDWFALYCFLFLFSFFLLSFFFPSLFIYLFIYFFFFWGGLSYIFGCDLISYGLILLSLWICVLMILARESIFRLGYFSGLFLSVVIFLAIIQGYS